MKIAIDLRRKIDLSLLLTVVALIVIGGESVRSTREFTKSAEIVANSHKVITALKETFNDIVSAESEARGYALTGDERFVPLYRESVLEVEDDLKALHGLVTDHVIEQRLGLLERLARGRLERLKAAMETRRLGGLDALPKKSGPGSKMMDELRQTVEGIEGIEQGLLAERDARSKKLARQTILVVSTGSIVAIILGIGAAILLSRDVLRREMLEKEVLEISERERRRIGQDLHDGVCQQLTGISLFSRSLQQKLAPSSESAAAEAARITELINDSIEEVRRVTRGLHPVPDEPTGLMLALQELANIVSASGKLDCRFICLEPVPIGDQTTGTHLYRIAQEAVQNAMRHSGASTIEIILVNEPASITLTVRDDGPGGLSHPRGKGMGLEIMEYRARSIGATLEVRLGPSRSAVVTCRLPHVC
jgi:signal transduction histidine kinase